MHVSLEDARTAAKKLKAQPRIRGVELFGSVLHNGRGHDVDFVVLVNADIARTWWTDMADDLRVRMATRWQPLRRHIIKPYFPWLDELSTRDRKKRRSARASELVGVDFEALANECKGGLVMDCFLAPENWRNGTELNIDALRDVIPLMNHNNTCMFLESIARRAVRM